MANIVRQVKLPDGSIQDVKVPEAWGAEEIRSALEKKGVLKPRQQAQPKAPETTPLGYVAGAGESALEIASGIPSTIAAGYAGLYEMTFGSGDPTKAADVVKAVQEHGTISASSEEGKQISKLISYIPGKLDEGTTYLGNKAMDAGASPEVAAAIKVGGDLVTMLLPAKLAGVAKRKYKARKAVKAEEAAAKTYQDAVDTNVQNTYNTTNPTEYSSASTRGGVKGYKSPVPTKDEFVHNYKKWKNKPATPEEVTALEKEASNAYADQIAKIQSTEDALTAIERDRLKAGLDGTPKAERPTPIRFKKEHISERKAILKDTASNVSKVLGSVVTVLDNIHPSLAQGIRRMEHNIENKMVYRNEVLKDFYDLSKKMYKGERGGNFHQAYLAQDWAEMRALAIEEGVKLKSGTINGVFEDLSKVLQGMGESAKSVNFRGFDLIPNYIPRHMTTANYNALVERGALPGDKATIVNRIIKKQYDDESMRHTALSRALLGGGRALVSKPVPGSAKRRYINQVSEDIANRYEPAHTAVQRYVDDMTEGVEIRRFLGEDKESLDLSVQSYIEKVGKDKQLTPRDTRNLRVALSARFTDGRKHAHPIVQTIKNLGYVETIANVWSAVTQLGDIAAGMTYLGVRETLQGAGQALRGKGINPKDIGYEQIMKEMASPSKSAEALSTALEWSGFAKMDRFGKRTIVNASAIRFKRMMKNPKQRAIIRSQYEKLLGNDLEQFMQDLSTGNIKNNNVRFAIFNDLADLQPITLSDMPIKYLQHPNLRILYALKTWTAHQLNTMYRRTVLESKRGNRKEAIKNLVKFSALTYGIGNVGVNTLKDWMAKASAGEALTAEDITDNAMNGLMQTFMVSRYTVNKNHGDVWGMLADTTKPAILSVIQRAQQAISKEDPELKDWIGLVPGIGPAIAAHERAKD